MKIDQTREIYCGRPGGCTQRRSALATLTPGITHSPATPVSIRGTTAGAATNEAVTGAYYNLSLAGGIVRHSNGVYGPALGKTRREPARFADGPVPSMGDLVLPGTQLVFVCDCTHRTEFPALAP